MSGEHIAAFGTDGWALEHPVLCRETGLLECETFQALSAEMADADQSPFGAPCRVVVSVKYWPTETALSRHGHKTGTPYIEYGRILDESEGPTPLLTEYEHRLVAKLGECMGDFALIIETGASWTGDINEFVDKIHQLQNTVLAQAAARAYPDRYRLLGGEVQ